MRPIAKTIRSFLPAAVLGACLAVSGCSMGYTNMLPGENSGVYHHLFQDVISRFDEPYWLWVRGAIAGDLDGNGVVDEEVVIATIQKGDVKEPGPIEAAFLVACRVDKDGDRAALARTLLFSSNPVPDAPKPVNDLGIVSAASPTRCRAQMVQDKVTLTETVVVYFWNERLPTGVWYVGYALGEDGWEKNLETAMFQSVPGFLTANLDRSIEASPYGYQLVFGVSAIPEEVFRKVGQAHEAPLWGHVFSRNAQGYYEQADERFGDNYRQLEGPWNQVYLKAVIKGLPFEDLAWFEYHLGILNYYTGNHDMSLGFLQKAKKYAKDPVLIQAVDRALAMDPDSKP